MAGCSGGQWLGRACTRGAARQDEHGGARGYGREGLERQGRGWQRAEPLAMADAAASSVCERLRARERAGNEWGRPRAASGAPNRCEARVGRVVRRTTRGAVHGGRVGLSTNTCRHRVGKVGAKLGRIWAELANGPKSKVVAHTKLYDFYLES
jgi:hypothetical protein